MYLPLIPIDLQLDVTSLALSSILCPPPGYPAPPPIDVSKYQDASKVIALDSYRRRSLEISDFPPMVLVGFALCPFPSAHVARFPPEGQKKEVPRSLDLPLFPCLFYKSSCSLHQACPSIIDYRLRRAYLPSASVSVGAITFLNCHDGIFSHLPTLPLNPPPSNFFFFITQREIL